MRRSFKDSEHLARVGGLFAVGVLIFLALRGILVPSDFGQFGHYRAGALKDNRSRGITFAGRAACLDCHDDQAKEQKGSRHERISCESCHGALAAHAADPEKAKAVRPDPQTLCVSCHLSNAGRPAKFPQIDPRTHYDAGECKACHRPHHPEPEG
jgi:predicted CXXCH cytochrome family protein